MGTRSADPSRPFELVSQGLGPLPVVNHFLARLGLHRLLEEYLPADDRRLKLDPAAAIGVVVRNLVLHREPGYGRSAINRW